MQEYAMNVEKSRGLWYSTITLWQMMSTDTQEGDSIFCGGFAPFAISGGCSSWH
jgi:hypothetical protein